MTNLVPAYMIHSDMARKSESVLPPGVSMDYWGDTAPAGWLMEFGQILNVADYPGLAAVLGNRHGGNGVTTFGVPDCRGRTTAGKDDMGGTAANRLTAAGGVIGTTLGAVGGGETHVLTTAQMPTHNHGVSDPGHTHAVSFRLGTVGTGFNFPLASSADNASHNITSGSTSTGISVQNNGSGNAHPNMQPTIVCNKIIKYARKRADAARRSMWSSVMQVFSPQLGVAH